MHGWSVGGGMVALSAEGRSPAYRQGGYAIYNVQVGYQFNKHVNASLTPNNIDRQ